MVGYCGVCSNPSSRLTKDGDCGVFGIIHGLVRNSGWVEAAPIAKLRGTRAGAGSCVAGTGALAAALAGVARAALVGGVAGTGALAGVAGRPTGAR